MENAPSETRTALVEEAKATLDRYCNTATHSCAPAVGNYLVLLNEIMKQVIDTITDITGEIDRINEQEA